jgi:aminomethyltransferase
MPLEFASGGVVAEHNAVRTSVGIFDVSHLGTAVVRSPGVVNELNQIFTNNLASLQDGQAQYNLLLDANAGVIDDLIVYRVSADEVLLIPNAANSAEVLQTLRESLPPTISVMDLHEKMAVLAIQGPASPKVLSQLGLPNQMPYMSFVVVRAEGQGDLENAVTVARTGYTGEIGYELVMNVNEVEKFWTRAQVVVKSLGGLAAGLGARDTLRTEMGYALHGHEISHEIDPLTAGLSWAIDWSKSDFRGRAALLAKREVRATGALTTKLVGLRAKERAVLRRGMQVMDGLGAPDQPLRTGELIGELTSGTFSPTLGTGIGLALITGGWAPGAQVFVDVRGRKVPCEVVKPPFVNKNPREAVGS